MAYFRTALKIGAAFGTAAGINYGLDTEEYKKFNKESLKRIGIDVDSPQTHLAFPAGLGTDNTGEDDPGGNNIVQFTFMERRGNKQIHNIYLPMPASFSLSDTAQYGELESSFGRQMLNAGTTFLQNAGTAIMDPNRSLSEKMMDLGNSESLSTLAADLAVGAQFASGLPIVGSELDELAFAAGAALDRGQRKRYTNNAIRTFSFNFDLQPKNKNESNLAGMLINQFRRFSYPKKGSNNLAVNYPPECIVSFRQQVDGKLKTNEYYPALLPAFLETFTTNYNPNTIATHIDGSPQAFQISLQFSEVKRLIEDEITALEKKRVEGNEHSMFYGTGKDIGDT